MRSLRHKLKHVIQQQPPLCEWPDKVRLMPRCREGDLFPTVTCERETEGERERETEKERERALFCTTEHLFVRMLEASFCRLILQCELIPAEELKIWQLRGCGTQ